MWLGEFPEDFTTVTCMFTTHSSTGAPVAPSTAFEAADVIIYKNGSATQKTSTNGVTMTSPFDSITGLHCVVIDTSNDTGDGGFWVAGAVYTLVLSPDETVDSVAVAKVIGQFGLELAEVLRPTTAGRQLDVSAGGEAGIDWANIGSPTTSVNLSATNIDVDQVVASVSGAVGSVTGLTAADVAAIKAKTDNLPAAPAATGDIPTANANADALLDRAAGVETGFTFRQAMRLVLSVLAGKVSGGGTATEVFRDVNDSKDRIVATVDASGNRTSVTRDAT